MAVGPRRRTLLALYSSGTQPGRDTGPLDVHSGIMRVSCIICVVSDNVDDSIHNADLRNDEYRSKGGFKY